MTKDPENYFERLKNHLPVVKDPTVVILRGHLPIEELLEALIAASLFNPAAIRDSRLTFFQKFCLCRGLIDSSDEDLWKPIEALNGLRNALSHNLPDETLLKKLDPVSKAFFPDDHDKIPNDIYAKSKALRKGVIFHFALLSGYLKGPRASSNSRMQQIAKKKRAPVMPTSGTVNHGQNRQVIHMAGNGQAKVS